MVVKSNVDEAVAPAAAAAPATSAAPAPRRPGTGSSLSPAVRLAIWAAMVASVFWTLVYQVSREGGEVPEFVYVNF